MKFYVNAIEQTHADGKLVEYSTTKQYPSEQQAKTAFYDKCKGVNADMSDNGHTFMDIKIVNSEGGTVKKDVLGTYVDEVAE